MCLFGKNTFIFQNQKKVIWADEFVFILFTLQFYIKITKYPIQKSQGSIFIFVSNFEIIYKQNFPPIHDDIFYGLSSNIIELIQ